MTHPMLFSRLSAGANRAPASSGTVVVPDPEPDPDPPEGGGGFGPPNTATLTVPTGAWPTIPLGFSSPDAERDWLIANGWPIIEGLGFHTPRTLMKTPSNPTGLVPTVGSLPTSAKTSWGSTDNGTTWNDLQFGPGIFRITGNNITFNRCVFRIAPGTSVNASGVGNTSAFHMNYSSSQGQNITFNNCLWMAENGPSTGHKGYQAVVSGGNYVLMNECVVLCYDGDAVKINSYWTVRNSYIHSMRNPASNKHNDSIQGENRTQYTIEGTTAITLNWAGGGGGNGVQMYSSDGSGSASATGIKFNDNMCVGGTYAVKLAGTGERNGNVTGPDSWTQYGSSFVYAPAITNTFTTTRLNKKAETGQVI